MNELAFYLYFVGAIIAAPRITAMEYQFLESIYSPDNQENKRWNMRHAVMLGTTGAFLWPIIWPISYFLCRKHRSKP